MSEVAIASLRELAGPELYRRNAFRVTGLPADVDRRAARQRQQQLTAALRVGADLDVPGSAAAPEELGAAFDAVLGDPRRRLVHEVFAEWGAPDGCGCPAGVHYDHDAAVRAHAAALAVEPADLLAATISGAVPGQWTAAATAWTKTLRSASFWRHLHHRVERLDDKQLNSSTVDALRAELPVALVRPLLGLVADAVYPAPLRKNLSEWPVPVRERDRLIEEAAEPLYAELESAVRDLHARLESGGADEVVTEMRARVNPLLARLEGLAPRGQHRRTDGARDRVAVLLNNCALARNRETGQYEGKVKGWLAEAQKLATDPETQRRVRENLAGFDEADAALNQFRSTVDELRRTRGRYEAARFLRGLLSQVTDEALRTAIHDMLSDLDAGAPISYHTPSRPAPYRPPVSVLDEYERQRRRRTVVGSLVACAIVVAVFVFVVKVAGGPDDDQVDIHPASYSAVPQEIICVRDAHDWRDGDTLVTTVACGQDHAGEVIAFLGMHTAVSSWPGADYNYLAGLARFECGEQALHFGLSQSADLYTTEVILPTPKVLGSSDAEANYATCLVLRADGERWSFRAASQQTGAQLAVSRPITSRAGRDHNAPAGYCVELKQEPDGVDNVWPIVRCDGPHWAEILGYQFLTWPPPGAPLAEETARVRLAEEAARACQQLASQLRVSNTFSVSPITPGWWTEQSRERMYAACVAHREDHQPFHGRAR